MKVIIRKSKVFRNAYFLRMENRFKVARTHHKALKLNRRKCYSTWQMVHANFTKLDRFGHQITLTYKGNDKF